MTKVDLQLIAGRGLDAHRRQCRGALGLPNVRDRALDRPDTDDEAAFGQQPLDHDRIASRRPYIQLTGFSAPLVG